MFPAAFFSVWVLAKPEYPHPLSQPLITALNQSYIRQSVDETLAGEIEGITVTDRVPIISSLSSQRRLLRNHPAV